MLVYWKRLLLFFKEEKQTQVYILVVINILLASIAFLKDILLARYFGTSYYSDSLYLAFFLPDIVGNGLLATAIGITCIPVFTRATTRGMTENYNQIINKVLQITLILSFFFLMVLLPVSRWLFTHFSQQIYTGEQQVTFQYFLIMLPIVVLSPMAIIAASILQVNGRFTKPAMMPVVYNVILLFSVLVCIFFEYPLLMGGYVYSVALLVSTVIVCILIWLFVLNKRVDSFNITFNPITVNPIKSKEIHLFVKLLIPYFCILLSQQIIFLVERYYASTLQMGTISGLTYAFRISQFPVWVFIAAINTVLLPTISKLKEDINNTMLKRELTNYFWLVFVISSFISLLFYLKGDRFISFLFLNDTFNRDSLRITTDIFTGFSLSIIGQSIYLFSLRYFVAFGKMTTPLLVSALGCFIHIVLIHFFVTKFGAKGMGYASAIGYTFTGALLLAFLYRDISLFGKKGDKSNYE